AAFSYFSATLTSPNACSSAAPSRSASTNCSVITADPPSSSCGGTPSLKSAPQSTNGHHEILPSSPSARCCRKNHSSAVLVPGTCPRTNSPSPRYIQKSCTIPTHISENVGIICTSEEGYRLCVSPSATRDASNASIACLASRSSPATVYEISTWIRVSPTYCSRSQYGVSM